MENGTKYIKTDNKANFLLIKALLKQKFNKKEQNCHHYKFKKQNPFKVSF